MRAVARAGLTGLILAAWSATACAQETPSQESFGDGSWTFRLAPYVWFAGLNGDVGVNQNLPVIRVDIDFDQIFDHIDWWPPPIMIMGEARYGSFAIVSDFLFLGLDADGSRTRGPVSVSADADLDIIIATLAGSFRVVEEGGVTVDFLAGWRLWNVDAKAQLVGPFAVRERSGDKTWVDPMVGVVGRLNLDDEFALQIEADIGGFNLASDSDWQVFGALQYASSDASKLEVGYRYLSVDYSHGAFLLDANLSGPMIGASFRF